jgi:type I restriction enzyme S subunit
LVRNGILRVEDGNHGEYRPRPHEFVDEGIPFIRAADMTSGVVNFRSAGKINEVARMRIRKGVGAPGDILLSHKGTVGKVAVAPADSPDYVCSPQTTFWRSERPDVLDQRYLGYVMLSQGFRQQLDVLKSQTDMAPYVSLTDQRTILLQLPAVDQQRAIAEVLGALDDKIVANVRLVELADALAGALARQSLSNEHVPLSDLADITMGSSPPGTSYNEVGRGSVFYQGVRDFGVRYPSNRVWTDAPVRTAEAGDTLVSVRAPVGRTNLASERTCIGRGLGALRSSTGKPMTLFHLLRDDPTVWEPYEAEGTVFGSINRSQLAALPVRRVIEERRTSLEEDLTVLGNRVSAALRESSQLATTRDQLLPLLMSGKVRVRDAEKVVEGVV